MPFPAVQSGRLGSGVGGGQHVAHCLELTRHRIQPGGVGGGQDASVAGRQRRARSLDLHGQFGKAACAVGVAELNSRLQTQHLARQLAMGTSELGCARGYVACFGGAALCRADPGSGQQVGGFEILPCGVSAERGRLRCCDGVVDAAGPGKGLEVRNSNPVEHATGITRAAETSLAERKYCSAAVRSPLPIAVIPSAAMEIHCDKPGKSAHR